jgi:hypothetical protein
MQHRKTPKPPQGGFFVPAPRRTVMSITALAKRCVDVYFFFTNREEVK